MNFIIHEILFMKMIRPKPAADKANMEVWAVVLKSGQNTRKLLVPKVAYN